MSLLYTAYEPKDVVRKERDLLNIIWVLYVNLPQDFFQLAINTWSSITVLYNDHSYFGNSGTWKSIVV